MSEPRAGLAIRLGVQQRVLPEYRAPFFEALARACAGPEGRGAEGRGALGVFAGKPLPQESIPALETLPPAQFTLARNRYFLHPASPFFLCWQAGLLAWLEAWQPQALVLEANPRYLSTPAAIRWMHARRRRVIGWGLGAPEARRSLGGLQAWLWSPFLRQFDALIAYSRRGAEQYRARGVPAGRIYVAANAVAPAPAAPPPSRPPQFNGAPALLFVGRLQARKRLDNLFRACAALPEALQPRLLVVGDGPARAEFEALAAALYPRAEFTGAQRGEALRPYFAAADLFVLPGTGGLAVQEAMAHALPVVVARGDGTQDDLVRPQNGWQVAPDDLDALIAALHEALSDPRRLRTMGLESYRIVSEEVNIEKMVEVFLNAVQGSA